jgi:hypothetical protein
MNQRSQLGLKFCCAVFRQKMKRRGGGGGGALNRRRNHSEVPCNLPRDPVVLPFILLCRYRKMACIETSRESTPKTGSR